MASHPQDGEVGEDLAVEHRFQVELDVGRTRETGVVPKEAQSAAVRQDGPQIVIGTVEQFLNQGMRSGGGGTGDAFGPPVEFDVRAQQMDRDRSPYVGDGVVAAVDADGGRSGQPTEAEFGEQRQEPALAGDAGGPVAAGEPCELGLERCPGALQVGPGAVDGLAQPSAGGEVIVVGPGTGEEVWLLGQQAEEVGGKEPAFGGDRGERSAGCHVRRAGRRRRRGHRRADEP